MEDVRQFFEMESLFTFGGASFAVVVMVNTYQKLIDKHVVAFGFVVSQIVAFIGAYSSGALADWSAGFVTILNGCLLFCTSAGMQETTNAAIASDTKKKTGSVSAFGEEKKWMKSWFRSA